MVERVAAHERANVFRLFDLALLLARFGPVDKMADKVHQLLLSHRLHAQWFTPAVQVLDQGKPISGCYSGTFSNCFVLRRRSSATVHLYNAASSKGWERLLFNEAGRHFSS
jgi:hypothetical protein